MDRAKRSRKPVRQRATKLCNDVEAELGTQVPYKRTMEILIEQLNKVSAKLEEHDEKVKEALLDEGKTDAELETEEEQCQVYLTKMTFWRKEAEFAITPQEITPPSTSTAPQGEQRSYVLPKIELPKFNGELKSWLGWWSQFEKIDKDPNLHSSDKFQYLLQATEEKSEPREMINVYPPTGDNYLDAIDTLKRRYGREGLQLQVYLRELLHLVIDNVTNKSKIPLKQLYLKLESHLRALKTLDLSKAEPSMYFYPLVESSLPEEIMRTWLRSNTETDAKKNKLEDLMEFLRKEVEGEQQIELAQSGFQDQAKSGSRSSGTKPKRNDVSTAASLYSGADNLCIFCDKTNHKSPDCYAAIKMTKEQKDDKIKENHACFYCLVKGHRSRICKAKLRCAVCGGKHHPVMCTAGTKSNSGGGNARAIKAKEEPVADQGQGQLSIANVATPTMTAFNRERQVLFKTLDVIVFGTIGRGVIVRLLFDEGSQESYIKTKTAEGLKCLIREYFKQQNALFGGQKSNVKSKKRFEVLITSLDGKVKRLLNLVSEDVICGSCANIPNENGSWIEELNEHGIQLPQAQSQSPEIEVLIGSDLWGALMTGQMKKLKCGLVAVESIFGWTLSGPLPVKKEESFAALSISMLSQEERSLPELWNLETIGIKDSAEQISKEEHDLQVRAKFKENIERALDGRYIVKLPWISKDISLPSNRYICEKRLITTTAKLMNQDDFFKYDGVFKGWEEEGLIEVMHAQTDPEHFFPHRPVFKPESLTTPVRPVFDASCKVGKNPSLNQCLEKGPNLLELIPSILLRFRQKKIGSASDIRKAYQMVGVAEEDRNFQKFLWWEDYQKKKITEYRHCRVVFGMNCSPFILAAVLEHHLDGVVPEDKYIAGIVKKSLYVDNVVISVDNDDEYETFKRESTAILARAKMELRQWERTGDVSERKTTGVLGLIWDKEEDTLQCQIPEVNLKTAVSKRSVLSTVSKIYDPIGVLCPATLQPKLLLQDSWATNFSWDEQWEEKEVELFLMWCEDLPALREIKIPRNAFKASARADTQIHTFTDASNKAYSAVIFARMDDGDQVSLQLLSAKARVAPLDKLKKKRVTIPRLELLGCLIGGRLTRSVIESLELPEEIPIHYWTDSSTALGWIKREEDWGTFVGNRVGEIAKISKVGCWRHVPGHLNPADLPSRGCSPSELLESKWWEGPSWLMKAEEEWPQFDPAPNEDEIAVEKKKTSTVMAAAEVLQPRFSSYLKNVRVASYVRRFINNSKKPKEKSLHVQNFKKVEIPGRFPKVPSLTKEEMDLGEKDLLRRVQQTYFKSKPELKNMDVKMYKDDLYHVKTRLLYREDAELFKTPILLPKDDPMVYLLVTHVHRTHCHAGTQFVLGKLREKYWILGGRKTIGKVIRKCTVCRRHSTKSLPCECDPAPLPLNRIATQCAFQTTGVDLAGPLLLKGGKKAWIVLYTCAVYRGVFLDIVDSLTTDDFIHSLERFTCIIGRPSTIYSDNGTNFVGAYNLMKTLDWKKLEKKMHVHSIKWIFNPPSSPWWGGWWERLVRTIKDLLKRMIGTAKLTRRELESCLASISFTINDRPLTTLTEDENDFIPLTPSMFMRDPPVSGLPEREALTGKDLQQAYAKVRDIKVALIERFRKEYLGQLIQRKGEKTCPDPVVGDIVLVGSDNRKRFQWPLGRILELLPGKDGKIRLAKVKTASGVFLRPLQRLYPLEISSQEPIPKIVPDEKKPERWHERKPEVIDEEKPERRHEISPEKVKRTRSGREIKLPSRYGKWNN